MARRVSPRRSRTSPSPRRRRTPEPMAVLAPEAVAVVVAPTPRRRSGALGWTGQVLSWVVMFFIGAVLLASLVVPRAFGATTYVIQTGSMRPHLPPGTMVAVKTVDPGSIEVGDVITYQLRSGDPTVVTHRVVAVGYDGTGEKRWQTQGDANTAADERWVAPVQLKGKLWYGVPKLGYVTTVVTHQQRGIVIGAFALGLGIYALAQFGGALRDRRRPAAEPAGKHANKHRAAV